MNRKENKMTTPEVVVLGPGGIKSLLIMGALFRLNQEGILKNVHTFIGVSAGSLISLMLVAGYSIQEIVVDAVSDDLLHDVCAVNLSQTKQTMGLIDHGKIRERLSKKIISKFGKVLTLKQLYLATGLTYISVSTNLDSESPHYFSWETEPDVSCVEAALRSMNIPFLFQKLDCYIDGALTDPYPILLKDDGKTPILGISVHTSQVGHGIAKYLHDVIQAPMTQLRKISEQRSSPMCKHIIIPCPTLDTLGLTLDPIGKSNLLIFGYQKAEEFLEQFQLSTKDESTCSLDRNCQ
ncbi:patatin-like phospholipase [Pithovirus sibericum]|uniref:Patatin-like phospholipase n=1 Tax=Pithovirus sibericum TaxID=1450746 RepID=W5S5M3_9VIRU|nr:patatin-like phospholipase [Pithovirus sibericum]AHH01577.1 patatin-like phospholipase [Pithovirus sibericum]